MFNPWSYKCEAIVGPIDPSIELRLSPTDFVKYTDKVRTKKFRSSCAVERCGNLLIDNTRFNYFDGKNHLGLACGEYTNAAVLQNFKRFIIQPDQGFIVNTSSGKGSSSGVHSDLYRRQVPLESLYRMLYMCIFNGTNVKNALQSGKSLLYYQITYMLSNCMRMYILPGPRLPCFSAILPLHALCTIMGLNINALPVPLCLVPIRATTYGYLADTLNVKYMFRFPPNVSFLDRRDPVIHDGGLDTCDKLFLTDDEFSDFRVNCTLNCKNRNEDYDGDTNNPNFCKGIESHAEIKYNMRTHLMPLLRNRHVFSQNVLFRAFVLLALDPPYEPQMCGDVLVRRTVEIPLELDLWHQTVKVLRLIDIELNRDADRRAQLFLGERYAMLYRLYVLPNLQRARRVVADVETRGLEAAVRAGNDEARTFYVDQLHKLASVWQPSELSSIANCYSVLDNVCRSSSLVLGDNETTAFVDVLLRTVHDRLPRVFCGEQPFCFTNIVNVLSTAKGTFDDILQLQRNFEVRMASRNELGVPLALADLLCHVTNDKLEQNKRYLDNFVYGSKKVPKNSKLAISTKWTLQNVIYYDGDLLIEGRAVLPDCFRVFSYEYFLDVDIVCAVFDQLIPR